MIDYNWKLINNFPEMVEASSESVALYSYMRKYYKQHMPEIVKPFPNTPSVLGGGFGLDIEGSYTRGTYIGDGVYITKRIDIEKIEEAAAGLIEHGYKATMLLLNFQ